MASLSWQVQAQEADSFFDLSLEELMGMEVTSISKKAEKLQNVAGSIYVLTGAEIMKAGATNLHEALRLVPGYWGAQDEYGSVITPSMRNSIASVDVNGTVLYLLDGTPMQDQMTSTFQFRNFDMPMDEIDRIEVIRGSGGVVYGANSATGVINIITKTPDKYDGIQARAEGAAPGFMNATLRAGGKVTNKLSLSGYGKVRYFSGFESLAGTDQNGNEMGAGSRFSEDFNSSLMLSGGFKAAFQVSEKTRLTLNSHYNTLSKVEYTNTYGTNSMDLFQQAIVRDSLFQNNINSSRLVANARLDHTFSQNHSLFVRISTNAESDFLRLGGGFNVDNTLYDFEVQDNLTWASINDLSVGFNYRLLNFNVPQINSPASINFIDETIDENLKGAFVQNKTRLIGDKLSLILGMKTENYTLVNDKFYFSPSAKVAFTPSDKLTVWGGFTQSYTTPGFVNTSSELFIFQTPTIESWREVAAIGVYQNYFNQYYQEEINNGADEASANATASQLADNLMASTLGQQLVNYVADGLVTNTPNVAVKNGTNTVPTRFRSYELGIRYNLKSTLTLETNLYYNQVADGLDVMTIDQVSRIEEAVTQPGRLARFYLYGNYLKGTSVGMENLVRYRPIDGLSIELSHAMNQSKWEYQENPDFDINNPAIIPTDNLDRTRAVPTMPEHIFRARLSYDIQNWFNVSGGIIHTSIFATQASYRFNDERYQNLADSRLELTPSTRVAENGTRTIVNLRIEKEVVKNKFSAYVFANDAFNKGRIAQTYATTNVTVSQIAAMYGLGLNYRIK